MSGLNMSHQNDDIIHVITSLVDLFIGIKGIFDHDIPCAVIEYPVLGGMTKLFA